MSDNNPYDQLGVTEEASFDEIQDAKGRLMQKHRGNQKLLDTVEAAYDAIIMDRLRMRQEGKIKVPDRIRFPEKASQAPPSFPQTPVNNSPEWLKRLWDTPTREDMIWPSAVFLILSSATVLYTSSAESILPLVMAIGFGFTIYFLNRKEQQFGRAVLLTLAGLFLGVGLGSLLGNSLGIQFTNLDLTPEKLATLVTFVLLWLISCFLR
ncbi:MAG: molecular chaperone DnaJ [Moorea sp. SIO1G6]|uniref:CPP1-like family protein n=1 Tax=Moorena sp. SIO1G6 TaxID=2607840 RepID=UPI0013C1781B|nr:CPP1-like family protein [Moorena sp. SIO1G6]NET64934.1 molecular chaperone DnaJ [Moorena sp. SIO1G6]